MVVVRNVSIKASHQFDKVTNWQQSVHGAESQLKTRNAPNHRGGTKERVMVCS